MVNGLIGIVDVDVMVNGLIADDDTDDTTVDGSITDVGI